MKKWIKIAVLLLLLAIMAGWYLPAQAKLHYAFYTNVSPIFVWINCGGVPVAFVATTSVDYLAGDVWQTNHLMSTRVPDMINEALEYRMLATIELNDRPWIECRVVE